MRYNILIAGAGQLGSRYLQGLVHCQNALSVYVCDVSSDSIERAKARWAEVVGDESRHELRMGKDFESLPKKVNVAIVATAADVRVQVVRSILEKTTVGYWVLEKVLAQNEAGIKQLEELVADSSRAWVNTPRRMMAWHQEVKMTARFHAPCVAKVVGGNWGLACNAIHFIDYFSWISGEKLLDVSTEGLNESWHPSKRSGYWEVFGRLIAHFSGGSSLELICEDSPKGIEISVRNADMEWQIDEALGMARGPDGLEVTGKLEYQSGITARLIDSILNSGKCELPDLRESSELHIPFLHALVKHWNETMPNQLDYIPIT